MSPGRLPASGRLPAPPHPHSPTAHSFQLLVSQQLASFSPPHSSPDHPTMLSRLLATVLVVAALALLSAPAVNGDAVAATAATATIRGRLRMPDDKTPINTTRITLNDGEHATYSQTDGTFALYNVGPGVHALNVHSHEHHFSTVKIQLLPESMDQPKCIEYAFAGAPKQPIAHPLELTAIGQYQYFEQRPRFSLMRIFKNPMMLMMLVSVGFMFFMPKMMEGLDDEQKEQMRAQMQMQNNLASDPTKAFSQLFSGGDDEGGANDSPKRISAKAGGKTARRSKRE